MEDLYRWLKYNTVESIITVGTGNYNWSKYNTSSSTSGTGRYNWSKYNSTSSRTGTGIYTWSRYSATSSTSIYYNWEKYNTTASNVGTGKYTWSKYSVIVKEEDYYGPTGKYYYYIEYNATKYGSGTMSLVDTPQGAQVRYENWKREVIAEGETIYYSNLIKGDAVEGWTKRTVYSRGSYIGSVTGSYSSYTNDARNSDGYWYVRGAEQTTIQYSRGSYFGNVIAGYSSYTNNARNSDGYWYVRGSSQTTTTYSQGSYVGSVTGSYSAYTNNARNSDGYWYVRGSEQTTTTYSQGSYVGSVTGSYSAYTNNARNSDGYWYVRGSEQTTTTYSQGSYVGSVTGSYSAYTNNARNSDGYWYVRGSEQTTTTTSYSKGSYVGTVVGTYSAYTNDAKNSDGYWYVRDGLNNEPPSITLVMKNDIVLSEGDVLEFSGTVSDSDTGEQLSVYFKINNSEKNTILSNVSSDQSYGKQLTFSDCKLYDGNIIVDDTLNYSTTCSISVWAEDRYGTPSDVKTVYFSIAGFYPTINLLKPIDYYAAKLLMYLREQTNLFREKNGFTAISWTVPNLIPNVTSIKAIDWNEIKNGIIDVYTKKGWNIKDDAVEKTLNEIIIANNKQHQIIDLPIKVDMIVKGLQNK